MKTASPRLSRLSRRELARTLGLGGAAALLGPLVGRLVSRARGEAPTRRLLFVLTDGNGWNHQGGGDRDPALLDPSRADGLPAVLDPLAPLAEKVTVLRRLYNPHGRNLHGNGWATLSVAPSDHRHPGGVSIDRFVAREVGGDDPFPSVALGLSTRSDRAAVSTSADGPSRPFPAEASPARAFPRLFGAAGSSEEALAALAEQRSVLDGLTDDVRRTESRLAGPERAKLEQMLGSLRDLEGQLAGRAAALMDRGVPGAPGESEAGLRGETVRDHVEVAAHAYAYGLTRVVHLSIFGRDAHNVGWGFLGFPGDAHESVAHVGHGYDRDRSTEAYEAIIRFKAAEIAHLFGRLAAEEDGDGTLADRAVALWVNSGGGKHHEGTSHIPLVLVGDAGGALRGGGQLRYGGGEVCVSQVFLSVARAMGSRAEVFGDPEHCPGPLADLKA